jgi:hypothetical protein
MRDGARCGYAMLRTSNEDRGPRNRPDHLDYMPDWLQLAGVTIPVGWDGDVGYWTSCDSSLSMPMLVDADAYRCRCLSMRLVRADALFGCAVCRIRHVTLVVVGALHQVSINKPSAVRKTSPSARPMPCCTVHPHNSTLHNVKRQSLISSAQTTPAATNSLTLPEPAPHPYSTLA